MRWLSRLSFAQAVGWAAIWPATILVVSAIAWAAASASDAAVAVSIEPAGTIPLWLALTLAASLLLLGPPVIFLAVWRLVRR